MTLGTPTGNFALFGGLVTTNYFDTFGVEVAHGRGFVARDDDAQDGVVVVISQRVWQERFNLAEDVVGRSITINRMPATIVGVAPAGFAGVEPHAGRRLVAADSSVLPIDQRRSRVDAIARSRSS